MHLYGMYSVYNYLYDVMTDTFMYMCDQTQHNCEYIMYDYPCTYVYVV